MRKKFEIYAPNSPEYYLTQAIIQEAEEYYKFVNNRRRKSKNEKAKD